MVECCSVFTSRVPTWLHFKQQKNVPHYGFEAILPGYQEALLYNKEAHEIETPWNESNDQDHPDRCDKVMLEIFHKKNLMVMIIAYISTSQIHVLRRFFKEWGSNEFKYVVDMVNCAEEAMKV